MRRWLALSMALHLLALVAWVRRPRDAPARPTPVTVELREQIRPAGPARGGRGRRAGRSRAGDVRLLPPGRSAADVAIVGRTYDPTAEDTSGWSGEHWGAGGGQGLASLVHALRFDKLMAEIDGSLTYPRALGERQIAGVINVRLRFAAGSRCAWPPRLEGAHPYLRVYVLAVLKKVCEFETLSSFGFAPGQTTDLSFAFTLSDQPGPRAVPGRVAGNVLLFERTYPRRRLAYRIGPVRGVWFAPVVSFDWDWVVEHWESWVDGKDPLRAFRASDP